MALHIDSSPAGETTEPAGDVVPARAPPLGLREVFEGHAGFVWRSLRYLGISERDLADLSQEVFLVVHRKLAEFQGRSSLRTWLYGICARVASDHRRRAHVRREVLAEEPPTRAVDPEQLDTLVHREQAALLEELLGKLEEGQRMAFVLYEIEELELQEVAEALGCPLKTVFSRVQAARKHILAGARRVEARRNHGS